MLSKGDIFKIFFRSLFVQSIFNFERMQSVGFVYTIFPMIKKLYSQPRAQKEVILRHLEFINTHPYFITLISGLIISKEEELSKGKEGLTPGDISVLKSYMTSPLAGIGDSLLWATYRPLISLLGMMITSTLIWIQKSPIWGIIFFLIIYNILPLYLRFIGIKKGYCLKENLIEKISKISFQRIKSIFNIIGITFLGILSSILCWFNARLIKTDVVEEYFIGIASLIIIIATGIGIRIRINPLIIFLFILGIGSLLVYFKTMGMWSYNSEIKYLTRIIL
ncbi:MAG: PTS system mannose/fructose/sorbose family transporter subunit IID [bacterium]